MCLNKKIWHGIFSHNAYSVVAQKLTDNETCISWAGLHMISKYKISNLSYEFIKLSQNNNFCLVLFTIDKENFINNDGLNPTDCKNYIVYSFYRLFYKNLQQFIKEVDIYERKYKKK